jgi:hypothetical protein
MLLLATVLGHGVAQSAEPPADTYTHMGVASCASSVCHGKLDIQNDRNVWLNEYRVWTRARRHSEAYRLLENEQSRRIVANLGLASATTAKICLDCHSDNVPRERRGPKFQITDGVSCEACHGGAENWLESHSEVGTSHEDNLARGMYPTESPRARARLCLSCHMGTPEKFATHDIMGAGHPRLSFELENFSQNQPAHYEVDDDYRERKGEIPTFTLWLAGQVEGAGNYLQLIRSEYYLSGGQFPELSFYDCHACHHPMDDQRWSSARAGPGISPGSPRLQDQHLVVLETVARVLDSADAAGELRAATERFVRAGLSNPAEVRQTAGTLLDWLAGRKSQWLETTHSAEAIRSVRRALVRAAADGRMGDYNVAEQVYLSLETLSYAIGDRQSLEAALDSLFTEVESNTSFNPASFAATAARIRDRF